MEEVLNNGDLAVADEIISPDCVYHTPFSEVKGPEGFKQVVTTMRKAFPDLHATIEDMVAEGNMVTYRFTQRGTFKGEFMGIAPTGKQLNITEAVFIRFEGGKEVEAWPYTDMLTLYRQLGIPIPKE